MYFNVTAGAKRAEKAAWSYPNPSSRFREIKDHLAFYAGLMDACYVNGKQVQPQPGGFYGGWVTENIIGPFKGEPGTWVGKLYLLRKHMLQQGVKAFVFWLCGIEEQGIDRKVCRFDVLIQGKDIVPSIAVRGDTAGAAT